MYIVTGGAGFIGSAIVWLLNEAGIDDILIVDNLASSDKWNNLVNRKFKDYIHKDSFKAMIQSNKAPSNVKALFHMGGCSSTTEINADYLMENNFHYTQMVCFYALSQGARFVNASSAATYGDGSKGFSDNLLTTLTLRPLNMYGYSKQLFDLWAYREGLLDKIVSLKFFNVYGPNEYHKGNMRSVVCKAYEDLQLKNEFNLFKSYLKEYKDGDQARDFVYVKDCAAMVLWFLEHYEANGIFNIGYGKARTWNDLAKAVYKAMGKEPNIQYIEMPEHLKKQYQYFTEADMQWMKPLSCDVQFHSLEEGVSDYIQNYLMNSDKYL